MRLVIDTNVLISALFSSTSLPTHLIELWRRGLFDLLTSAEQLDELKSKVYIRPNFCVPGRPTRLFPTSDWGSQDCLEKHNSAILIFRKDKVGVPDFNLKGERLSHWVASRMEANNPIRRRG